MAFSYYLLITERPLGFDIDNILIEKYGQIIHVQIDCHVKENEITDILIIDMSYAHDEDSKRNLIKEAKNLLEEMEKEKDQYLY